ncbi:Thiol-disulfide oxidoreductase ResA [Metarhizium anisopliae]|nr:Thiol-disulfide oxidoreductase ResA [Metarhizium anisopliae]
MSATLASQLAQVTQKLEAEAPKEVKDTLLSAKAEIEQSFDPKRAIQPGAKLPQFNLPDATGKVQSSSDLLAKGPLLITFYRGEWCPFCNLALRALQLRLPEIEAKGVTLVAVSPELPDTSLSTVDKNELKFPVLSDVGLKFARELGIVWKQPEALRPVLAGFGTDLKARNGDDSFEVPIPTTILVDQHGTVRNVHAEPDYFKRLEPQDALDWIDAL